MRKKYLIVLISIVLMIGLGSYFLLLYTPDCTEVSLDQHPEVEVIPIALADPLSRRSAEISGMDWYGDYLIILPQYFDHADGRVLYAIPKAEILDYLSSTQPSPIEPVKIPVEDRMFGSEYERGFEGYEAIAFEGHKVYLTVEIETKHGMAGYLISGEIEPDLSQVVLDIDGRKPIPLQQQIDNFSDEALLVTAEGVVAFYEGNGAAINPQPVAHVFNDELNLVSELPFPTIEYRVTDATRLDSQHTFWVSNFYSLGSFGLKPQEDLIAKKFGQGCTHAFYPGVERLLELKYDPEDGFSLTETPPIQLVLQGNLAFRNWEGIVRLDELGFLIASDKYHQTILGFVPFP